MSLSSPTDVDLKDSKTVVVDQNGISRDEKNIIAFSPTASTSTSPAVLPTPTTPGCFGDIERLPTKMPQQEWKKRRIPRWKSPLLMLSFFVIGLTMSLAHCIFYPKLNGAIVGDSSSQEGNIRFGTAFSFLAQISLAASVWTSYTQWLWRTVNRTEMTVGGLNAAFGADTSFLSLLNLEMLRKLRIGSMMALFAWSLLLPPFFTPATLFVYPSTNAEEIIEMMPYPAIADSSVGHKFAYSPPTRRGTTQNVDDTSRIFTGPRTVLNLISTATASLGEILTVSSPYNTASYSISFFAPIIKCQDANSSETDIIYRFQREEMETKDGSKIETNSAYYSFVPTFNSSGGLIPVSKPRPQSPIYAMNQLWMTFLRPTITSDGSRIKQRHYQVCRLYNASYDLSLSQDHGFQNISGSYTIHEDVPFPNDKPDDISNMAQHAYTAFMWVIANQLVGKFAWVVESNQSNSSQFGVIDSQLQRTSLLGSLDLDAFFEFDEEYGLYKNMNVTLSDQRLQDKAMAKNRTLDVLIEELSFNTTVSLMHDILLTFNTTTTVLHTDDVNRYGYKPYGLFIPYGLANLFTLITVLIGIYSYAHDDVMPDKKFQDIVSAAEDPEIMQVVRSRKRSVTAVVVGDNIVLRAGPDRKQKEALKRVGGFWRVSRERRSRWGKVKKRTEQV